MAGVREIFNSPPAPVVPPPAAPSFLAPIAGRPRAAAVAGIIFSVLLILVLGIIRLAVPSDPHDVGAWLVDPVRRNALNFAFYLTPFAGIAFLWFIGVLRDRLGSREDRFFATVFLGSGLLFVASLFCATAIAGALIKTASTPDVHAPSSEMYYFARRAAYMFINIFAIKMAAVFIFSTCTLALRTAILPRWIAWSGFPCGVLMLIAIASSEWVALLFPLWILLVSSHILVADLVRVPPQTGPGTTAVWN